MTADFTNDINNIGGLMDAEQSMRLRAGNDINVTTQTRTSINTVGDSRFERTDLGPVAGIHVNAPDGQLQLKAGHDINLTAADIQNRGDQSQTEMRAGNDLNLRTVTTGFQNNVVDASGRIQAQGQTLEQGTSIDVGGDMTMRAERNINVRAATVTSAMGHLDVSAGNDVNVENGIATANSEESRGSTTRGRFGLSSSSTEQRFSNSQTDVVQTVMMGNSTSVDAGRDVNITGSQVLANQDLTISAARDINILNAQGQQTSESSTQSSTKGLFSNGGLSVTLGKQSSDNQDSTTQTTSTPSVVGSQYGNVVISAGRKYTQQSSVVAAGGSAEDQALMQSFIDPDTGKMMIDPATGKPYQPQTATGNVIISAQTKDIRGTVQTTDITQSSRQQQSGLTLSASTPLSNAIQGAQSIGSLIQAGNETDNPRMQAMALGAGLVKANELKNAVKEMGDVIKGPKEPSGGSISASIGSSRSQSESTEHLETYEGSQINALNVTFVKPNQDPSNPYSMEVTETRDTGIDDRDGNRIYATDGSLTVQGSQVNAPGVIRMLGEDEVNLVAGRTQDTISTKSSSSAAAIGVSVKVDKDGGTGVTADISASKGNGSASGSSVNYTDTVFNTGTVVADISGPMRVVGAQVNAAGAVGRIGGDLEITSLQNTSTYTSDQQSSGFSVNIPLTTNTAGSASVNASRSNLNNSFASVGQQSGIFTGDGGFDLDVGGTTYLTGGVLTTTDTGVAERRNQIRSQGGIVYRDLENHAISDGSSTSVGLSIGLQKPETGKQTPAEASAANNQGNNNRPAINGIGWGQAGSSNSSITTAGISGLGGDSSVRTGTDSSNALSNDFNAAAMQQNLGAQVRVTQEFGQAVPKAVGTYADNKVSEALRRGDFDEAKRWSEGGIYRVAMHTAVGALGTGTVTGAAVSGGVALAANQLNELQAKMAEGLVSAGLSPAVANSVSGGVIGLGIAAAGNAAGVPAAGYMAANTDMNNRQLHFSEVEWIKRNANQFVEFARRKGIVLTRDQAIRLLALQAVKQVDLIAAAGLPDGDNNLAKLFLSTAGKFENSAGGQQQMFTTQGMQYIQIQEGMDDYASTQDFYKTYITPSFNFSQMRRGLTREAAQVGIEMAKSLPMAAVLSLPGVKAAVEASELYRLGLSGYTKQALNDFRQLGQDMAGYTGQSIAASTSSDIMRAYAERYGTDMSAMQHGVTFLNSLTTAATATGVTGVARLAVGSATRVPGGLSRHNQSTQGSNAARADADLQAVINPPGQRTGGHTAVEGSKAPKGVEEIPVNPATGLKEVNVTNTPLEGQSRLNTPDVGGSGQIKPAEAAVGAQLEGTLGTMTRAPQGASYDFVTADGKTVDVMYSTDRLSDKEIIGINKFYEKNMTVTPPGKTMPRGQEVIIDHIQKADYVPVDFRVLTPVNQKIFIDFVRTLPASQQAKIIIVR